MDDELAIQSFKDTLTKLLPETLDNLLADLEYEITYHTVELERLLPLKLHVVDELERRKR